MALLIPHQSNQGIAVGNAGAAAQMCSASSFMAPGADTLAQGMQQLGRGVDAIGGVLFKEEVQKRQEQMELALLEDVQNFQADFQAWSDDYQKNHQGKNAVNAEQDATAFLGEKAKALQERWQGNERAQHYIQQSAGGLAVSGVNAMRDYGNKQQEAWKDSELARDRQVFLSTAADPNKSPEEIRESFQSFATRQAAYLIGKGLDATAAQLQVEQLYKEAINANVYSRLAIDAEANPQEALRVLDGKPRSVNLPEGVAMIAQGAAESSGVSPDLVKAVIFAESAGKADALSPKGARGLMQLMPKTQKELEKRHGIDGNTPEGNIKLGTLYLKEMLKRYDGDEQLALMAYNWGPGNVDAFIKTGRGVKGQPVPLETRQYVNKIIGSEESLAEQMLTPTQKFKLRTVAEVHSADSLSDELYKRVSSGKMSEAQAREQITGIENQKMRRAAHQGFTERLQIAKVQEREDTMNAGERAYDDMTRLANSNDKSDAAILGDMYKLRLDAEIKARTGGKAEKAYFRSVEQMYSSAISGLGITNRSDPGVFTDAQNAIMYGKVTNPRDLKATYPALAFRDMERLESVLKSSQQVNLAEVNRLYDIYAGLNPDLPADAEERAEHKARRMALVQNVIDSAKESNRGNDPEWVKTKVAQFFVAGEDRGLLYDTDMTAGEAMTKGVTFYPDITEEVRSRIKAEFTKNPVVKDEYMKKHGQLSYAIRARYWDQEQQRLGAREPERPDDVPDDAVWDKTRMGWVGTNPQTGRPGFRPLMVR